MYVHNCHLLSFPTRRSSDLWRVDQVIVALETDGWFAQTSATPENTTAAYRRRTSETGDGPSVAGVVPSSDGLGSPSDRKSTRLNSSHRTISYAVFCLKKKKA